VIIGWADGPAPAEAGGTLVGARAQAVYKTLLARELPAATTVTQDRDQRASTKDQVGKFPAT
jgi:hypothetical protein